MTVPEGLAQNSSEPISPESFSSGPLMLASQSASRKAMLAAAGIPFEAHPKHYMRVIGNVVVLEGESFVIDPLAA